MHNQSEAGASEDKEHLRPGNSPLILLHNMQESLWGGGSMVNTPLMYCVRSGGSDIWRRCYDVLLLGHMQGLLILAPRLGHGRDLKDDRVIRGHEDGKVQMTKDRMRIRAGSHRGNDWRDHYGRAPIRDHSIVAPWEIQTGRGHQHSEPVAWSELSLF